MSGGNVRTAQDREVLDVCEECGCDLHAGDNVHACSDGPMLCERCAPTYREIQAYLLSDDFAIDRDQKREGLARIAEHLHACGSIDDAAVSEL